MKHFIIITTLLIASCNPISFKTCLNGVWVNKGIEITFDNNNFVLKNSGLEVTKEGFFRIENDTVILNYKDYYLNWQWNEQRVFYQRVENGLQIFDKVFLIK